MCVCVCVCMYVCVCVLDLFHDEHLIKLTHLQYQIEDLK